MGRMRRALVVLVMCAASRAHAQAPGQLPAMAPSTVMERRWAVGLTLGSESLTPSVSGAAHTAFGVLELAGRFRIRPAWELALDLDAGGSKGQLSTAGLALDVRYRFLAEQPWNGFVLAGLGVASAANKDAPDAERKGRGSLRFGGGIERRFQYWALEAELHVFGIAANADVGDRADTSPGYQLARYGVTGASLSLGATVYF